LCKPHYSSEDVWELGLTRKFFHADFSDGLTASLGFAGPENFCPVLVGAIIGAYFGVQSITKSNLHHASAELQERVNAAAKALSDGWKDD
jgi:ADP-ribosylglycohydrolase